jgi:hypothetical protein
MLVQEAKARARQWVIEEGSRTSGFAGAFFAGSAVWLPAESTLPATSDVDLWVVLDMPEPGEKLGKFRYRDVLLEVSYLSRDRLQSPEQILGDYHLAGTFWRPNVIADPSGELTRLQTAVARDYAKRAWVRQRCEAVEAKIRRDLQGVDPAAPFHDQVTSWLFATGVTTHMLLVAGLRNPTVRQRYLAARTLLADYGRLDFYERLLALLGCAEMSRSQAEGHLAALTEVFDATKTVIKTPFFFAADISDLARSVPIDGSRELIEQGHQREAVFWMVATYARCQKVLDHDAPVLQAQFEPGFRRLVADLEITSVADLQRRSEETKAFLPQLWTVTETILAANPEIEDEATCE